MRFCLFLWNSKPIEFFFFKIRNFAKKDICIDSQEVEDHNRPIIGYPCHGQGGNQYFLLSKNYEIRREEKCLDYAGGELHEPSKILSMECHSMKGNQMWSYTVCLHSSATHFFHFS